VPVRAGRVALVEPGGSLAGAEKQLILSALKRNSNNRTKAAEELGISRRTLHRKLKTYAAEAPADNANQAEGDNDGNV